MKKKTRRHKDELDGVLLIDKQEGETSLGVVKKVKRLLNIKKAGHAGTLDPFATGLLIVLIGQGTKLSNFLMSGVKRYRATLKLGVKTDTQDPTGRVIEKKSFNGLDPARVREETGRFTGDIEQVPPMFSAVKVRGQRAYHLARRGIQMELKKRRVTIYAWNSISVDLPFVSFEVTCSGGTYIRTLGADLGQALGPGGHLVSLRRLSSGSFDVGTAVDSALIRDDRIPYPLGQDIIPLSEALPDMKEVHISAHMANKIKDGYQPKGSDLFPGNNRSRLEADLYKLLNKTELVAVISVRDPYHNDRPRLRIERVFH